MSKRHVLGDISKTTLQQPSQNSGILLRLQLHPHIAGENVGVCCAFGSSFTPLLSESIEQKFYQTFQRPIRFIATEVVSYAEVDLTVEDKATSFC